MKSFYEFYKKLQLLENQPGMPGTPNPTQPVNPPPMPNQNQQNQNQQQQQQGMQQQNQPQQGNQGIPPQLSELLNALQKHLGQMGPPGQQAAKLTQDLQTAMRGLSQGGGAPPPGNAQPVQR